MHGSPTRATVRGALGLVVVAVVTTACGAPAVQVTASPVAAPQTPAGTSTPTPSASPTPEATPTPTAQFPLTGVATEDAMLERSVMAVKIDNNPAAFPHTGLERADVVYEEVVEGGLTRLVPLFHSDLPDVIGPVRSGRLVDVDLLSPYHPILVYAGARAEVSAALRSSGSLGLVSDSGKAPFFRDASRSAPHDLYFDAPDVLELGSTRSEVEPVSSAFLFGDMPDDGAALAELDVAMTYWQTTSWEWDTEASVYRRSTRGDPYEVAGEGRVGAANVVVVLTSVTQLRGGEQYMSTDLIGEGDAVLLRDGRRHDIQWRKADTESHMEFVFADGTPVPFAVGPTWIHLAPFGAVG